MGTIEEMPVSKLYVTLAGLAIVGALSMGATALRSLGPIREDLRAAQENVKNLQQQHGAETGGLSARISDVKSDQEKAIQDLRTRLSTGQFPMSIEAEQALESLKERVAECCGTSRRR